VPALAVAGAAVNRREMTSIPIKPR
jgi:hypothetical protein